MRILVVEDDRKVASFLQKGLEEEGNAVDVDLNLPGRSGLQVLRDIRAVKPALPYVWA